MLDLKNKAEREQFLKEYKNWTKDDCAIHFGLTFYIRSFNNGAKVIVTECIIPGSDNKKPTEGEHSTETRYNLIIPEADKYNPFNQNSGHSPREFFTYNLSGIGIGTIVDYMTKNKNVI